MAPAAKSGGKSQSGVPAAGGAAQTQPRTISTRSQKAGLQVRGFNSLLFARPNHSFLVSRRTYSSIPETANST